MPCRDLTAGAAWRRSRHPDRFFQRALLRDHPHLSAGEVMALTSGDPDNALDRAGRRTDELLTASRRGIADVGHRFVPQQNG